MLWLSVVGGESPPLLMLMWTAWVGVGLVREGLASVEGW